MEQELFDEPVPVLVGMGHLTHVRSVSHAHALLSDWPGDRRGTAHALALKACKAAMAGALDAETARRMFERFARGKDILAPDARPLVAAISDGSVDLPGSR